MAETSIVQPKKVRNYAVDFWRFFATLAVCWGHFANVGFRFTDGGVNYPDGLPFQEGSVLGVFLILTGYFLMKSFAGKKSRGQLEGKTPSQNALTYLKTRFIGLWPALFMGVLVGFVVGGIGAYTGLWHGKLLTVGDEFNGILDVIAGINTNILQFMGLDALGMLGDTGWAYQYNSPLWYISVIFVAGYFLYYALCKNEDVTRGLIVPAILVIIPSVWAYSDLSMNDRGTLFLGLFDNAIAFGGWGMALGIFLYRPYEAFRTMKLTEKGKKILTVISVVLFVYMAYLFIMGADGIYATSDETLINSEIYIDLVVAVGLAFAVANQDYFTQKVLNKPIFGTLGKFSLYYFIVHIVVINVVCGLVGGENVTTAFDYYLWLVVVNVICFVVGWVMQQICEKGITPLLNRLDQNIQAAIARGKEEAA